MMAVFTPSVMGNNQEIQITLTPNATATISCNQTDWAPGCGINEEAWTSANWGAINNTGSVSVSVDVNASDSGDWNLSSSAIGNDQFRFNITGAELSEHWFNGDTSATFDSDLPYDTSETFRLGVQMPSSTSTNSTQQFKVTFVATAL